MPGARDLVTLAEAKDWLNVTGTADDTEIARVITDISDRIHQEAGREFVVNGTNPQTRLFDIPRFPYRQPVIVDGEYRGDRGTRTVDVGDLASFTQVRILDYDWTTSVLAVPNTSISARPLVRQSWEPIRCLEFNYTVGSIYQGRRVEVTGNFGFPAIPGNIRQACLDAIAAVLDRDVEHYRQDLSSVSSQPGDNGTVIMQVGGSQRILSLPPVVLAVCWSYRDPALA